MNETQNTIRHLDSVFGYVGTMTPEWSEDRHDLKYAIDSRFRMKIRIIDYSGGRGFTYLHRRKRKRAWIESMTHAPIDIYPLDESATLPDEQAVRQAMAELIERNICGEFYVAAFNVSEETGLDILLGYPYGSRPQMYAAVNLIYPMEAMHLRFRPVDRRIVVEGRPIFYDVHLTDAPGRRNHGTYEEIRVREYYPNPGPNLYDVCDLMFAERKAASVPVRHYKNVGIFPAIAFSN